MKNWKSITWPFTCYIQVSSCLMMKLVTDFISVMNLVQEMKENMHMNLSLVQQNMSSGDLNYWVSVR